MALRLLAGGGSLGDHVLSNDGALLLVACVDSVLAYATATGEQAFRLQHAAPVTALCLQPGDDSRLLTGSKDGQLTLWDLTTGTAEKQWSLGSPVESLVTSRTGDAGAGPFTRSVFACRAAGSDLAVLSQLAYQSRHNACGS